jgi:hypothetical protein
LTAVVKFDVDIYADSDNDLPYDLFAVFNNCNLDAVKLCLRGHVADKSATGLRDV